MTSPTSVSGRDPFAESGDFSLVLGGPLFQLWRRLRLSDDSLKLFRRRVVLIPLLCWLPLLVISALEGQLMGGSAAVPFLLDLEAHVRFLIATPLIVGAELVVHERMLPIMRQFKERALLPAHANAEFDAATAAALRLRNSVLAEVLLIAFVYVVGILVIWQQYVALSTTTWYATPSATGSELSLAGSWYSYVSLPFFQFLMCRWYFRLFIWARLLRRISRIDLNIVPTHPDHAAGLGFLSGAVNALAPLATAHGVLLAGNLGGRIFHLGAKLPDFKPEIALVLILMLGLVLGPLLVFVPQLSRAKRTGRREYDALAQRYVREFDRKWLRGGAPADEPLVGSGDIGSLADLGTSLEVVRSMRTAPIGRDSIVQIAAATLVPLVPLLLTMMPLEELIKKLFGILF